MHPMLTYPFNPSEILKKRKKIKRELTEQYTYNIKKKIAVLGGSTTHDITEILELFLLNYGICPEFYEAFSITENDGMWVAPENRVRVW